MSKVKVEIQFAKRKRKCHNCNGKILKNDSCLAVIVRDSTANICKSCYASFDPYLKF
jgi:hypothetical protein